MGASKRLGRLFVGLGIVAAVVVAGGTAAAEVTDGFEDEVVITGRSFPTTLDWLPDGRVLVAEKSGRIWLYDDVDDADPTLFADLSDAVHNWWDRGLLGLAVDPAFPAEPYVYVQYTYNVAPGHSQPHPGFELGLNDACPDPPGATSPRGGCVVSGRLSRLTVADGGAGDTIMPGSEVVLIEDWCASSPATRSGRSSSAPTAPSMPPAAMGRASRTPTGDSSASTPTATRRRTPAVTLWATTRLGPPKGVPSVPKTS
ncbi:MAG TPA: hypothetical protein ENK55_05605 [Actinobacteria bacterium]|nr:hypothetical protein [Actinomycetota bacterium]